MRDLKSMTLEELELAVEELGERSSVQNKYLSGSIRGWHPLLMR